jgi:hypothetical protein
MKNHVFIAFVKNGQDLDLHSIPNPFNFYHKTQSLVISVHQIGAIFHVTKIEDQFNFIGGSA